MEQITTKERFMITLSVMLAAILQVIDSTIANVALPHMQGSLSATQDQISWVLTSYIVSSAIATTPIGWLSGKYGIKKVFLVSVAGFVISSVLCGMATSITEMVLFRLLQGLFGAALVPLSQATLFDINPPEKHGAAMALWGVGIMVGPIIGPTLGGYLTEYYNWRWVFYVNVPFGILAFFGIITFFKESEVKPKKFDFIGFGLLSVFIACIQLILDRGELLDWLQSPEIMTYSLVALISIWFFILHMKYAINPFLTIKMFKNQNFIVGLIMIFFVGIILMATSLLLSPLLQSVMKYPVVTTGLLMVPRGVGTLFAMGIVGKLMGRINVRSLILFGLLLVAFSSWQMTKYSLVLPHHFFITSTFIQGVGFGFIFVPLSTITFATLPQELRAEAAGFFSLLRNIGGSIGIAAMSVMLSRYIQVNHSILIENSNPTNYLLRDYLTKMNSVTHNIKASMAILDGQINLQSAFIAYLNDFKFLMFIALLPIPLLFWLKLPKQNSSKNNDNHLVAME